MLGVLPKSQGIAKKTWNCIKKKVNPQVSSSNPVIMPNAIAEISKE